MCVVIVAVVVVVCLATELLAEQRPHCDDEAMLCALFDEGRT